MTVAGLLVSACAHADRQVICAPCPAGSSVGPGVWPGDVSLAGQHLE
jgi:hypothetical protein